LLQKQAAHNKWTLLMNDGNLIEFILILWRQKQVARNYQRCRS